MNLRKLLHWANFFNTAVVPPLGSAARPTEAGKRDERVNPVDRHDHDLDPVRPANVVPFPRSAPHFVGGQAPDAYVYVGLADDPAIKAFFDEDHAGLGRHTGCNCGHHEAMDRDLAEMISRFQNILDQVAARRRARLDKLEHHQIDVGNSSDWLSARLTLLDDQLTRDMAELAEQATLAEDRRGWVLQALNAYRRGFDRGVGDSIAFRRLFD